MMSSGGGAAKLPGGEDAANQTASNLSRVLSIPSSGKRVTVRFDDAISSPRARVAGTSPREDSMLLRSGVSATAMLRLLLAQQRVPRPVACSRIPLSPGLQLVDIRCAFTKSPRPLPTHMCAACTHSAWQARARYSVAAQGAAGAAG